MKKKILIYGNCQHTHLERFLAETKLTQYFDILRVKDVYRKDKTGLTEEDLKKVDLFVHQHVSREFDPYFCSDNIKSLLKPTAETICIPNFWFSGYHEQQAKNPILRRNPKYSISPSGIFAYGDKYIVAALRANKSKAEIISGLSDPNFIDSSLIEQNLKSNFDEIKRREEEFKVDIPSLTFIKSTFLQENICCTVNHPNAVYFKWLTREILKLLNIDHSEVSQIMLKPFDRGFLHVPVYPSVIKALGLHHLNSDPKAKQYKFYNQMYSFEDYVDYYVEHSTFGNVNGKDVVRFEGYKNLISGKASFIQSEISNSNINRLKRIYSKSSLFDSSQNNQVICGAVKVTCPSGLHKDIIPGLTVFFNGVGNKIYIDSETKFVNSTLLLGSDSYIHFSKSTWHSLTVNNKLHNGGVLFVGEESSGRQIKINLLGDNVCFIDDSCLLDEGTRIFCSDSHSIVNKEGFILNQNADVIFGKNVWCAANSIILKGSKIGDNSVITAGSIYSLNDGEGNSVFSGNPARLSLSDIQWKLPNPGTMK